MGNWSKLENSPFAVEDGEIEFDTREFGVFAFKEHAVDKLFLYNSGNEYSSTTGGWGITAYEDSRYGTLTKNPTNMYAVAPQNNVSTINVSVLSKINLTNYSKFKAVLRDEQGYRLNLCCGPLNNSYSNYGTTTIQIPIDNVEKEVELDISNITGDNYVWFRVAGAGWVPQNQCYFYKVWLE